MGRRLSLFWVLFVASVKMFVRNRAAVFFSIFLPLVIMLIFGVLNFDQPTSIQLGVADDARNDASTAVLEALGDIETFAVTTGSQDAELAALEDGDRELVLVIPSGFGADAPQVSAYAAAGAQQDAQLGSLLLNSVIGQALFAPGGSGGGAVGQLVDVQQVNARSLHYIDFLVPGILGLTIMQLGLFGVAFGFVQMKRTGALRRLFATPTPPAYFLSAQVLSRLIIGFVQVAILIGVGLWFGLQMFGDYATLLLIVLFGSAIFLAVGFAIAGWAKNEDQAAPVANLVSLPMMFLSGVFFPREAMPDFLAGVTAFMPLTYVNEA